MQTSIDGSPAAAGMARPAITSRGARPARTSWLPAACAVHCVVAPLVAGSLPFVHLGKTVELALLVVSALIAGASLLESRRSHRRWIVWLPVLLGIGLWGASLDPTFAGTSHGLMAALGGGLIAAGLVWDGRVRHRAACPSRCDCPLRHES
jgi:hypothetical protein